MRAKQKAGIAEGSEGWTGTMSTGARACVTSTTYFPLIVDEALMIEPTETESKETLDQFCDAMIQIAREAESNPQVIHDAPVTTPVRRLDQTLAARQPKLRWRGEG